MAKQVTVCIIGRGKSGTRIPAQLLLTGDGFIGTVINASLDKTPYKTMYEAARIVSQHVKYTGDYQWDFSKLHELSIPDEFKQLINDYLEDVWKTDKPLRGWKLPETIFTFPLLVRLFPDIHYLYWYRNPNRVMFKYHNSDNIEKYDVKLPELKAHEEWEKILEKRALSWLYQWQIVHDTPKPQHFLPVSYEEFIRSPEQTTEKIEEFIGCSLGRIVIRPPEHISGFIPKFPFLQKPLEELGYVQATDERIETPVENS